MWLQDTGILIRLRDSELKAPYKIPLPNVKPNESQLTIFQLATIFIFATTGIVLSVFIFLSELVIGRKITSKSNREGERQRTTDKQIHIFTERYMKEKKRGKQEGKDKKKTEESDVIRIPGKVEIITPHAGKNKRRQGMERGRLGNEEI